MPGQLTALPAQLLLVLCHMALLLSPGRVVVVALQGCAAQLAAWGLSWSWRTSWLQVWNIWLHRWTSQGRRCVAGVVGDSSLA